MTKSGTGYAYRANRQRIRSCLGAWTPWMLTGFVATLK